MNKKALKLAVRLILSAGAIYMIVRKVDFELAWLYLKKAQVGFLLLAVLSFFISRVIAAYRINHLYRTQGLNLGDLQNIKLLFLGMFYNLFIPLVGGEGYKAYWIKKRSEVGLKSLVWSALLDRAAGLTALVLITAIFFHFSGFEPPNKALYFGLVPLAYAGHYLVNRLFFSSFLPAWKATQLLSIPIQLLQAVAAYFVIMAIGIDTGVLDYIFVFMLATFAFVIPVIGAREMAFVFGADVLGLNMEISLAIGLLFYLCIAINSLIGTYFIFNPKAIGEEIAVKLSLEN